MMSINDFLVGVPDYPEIKALIDFVKENFPVQNYLTGNDAFYMKLKDYEVKLEKQEKGLRLVFGEHYDGFETSFLEWASIYDGLVNIEEFKEKGQKHCIQYLIE